MILNNLTSSDATRCAVSLFANTLWISVLSVTAIALPEVRDKGLHTVLKLTAKYKPLNVMHQLFVIIRCFFQPEVNAPGSVYVPSDEEEEGEQISENREVNPTNVEQPGIQHTDPP